MRAIALAGAAVALASCASLTRGHTNQVHIHSDPPGAEARTSLGHTCITPCSLQFNRKDEFSVTVSRAGYEPKTIPVRAILGGEGAAGFAGNLIIGGVGGMVVDAATGATLEHCPNPVTVVLQPLSGPRRPEPAPPVCGVEPVAMQ